MFPVLLSLGLLAGTALAQNSTNVTDSLSPVFAPDLDRTDLTNIQPAPRVCLHYGRDNTSYVNVTLQTHRQAVVLEESQHIADVVCTNETVAVTFNSSAAFHYGVDQWPATEPILLVTNHMGNCDVELERGFFVASEITWDNATLTITADAERKNVTEAASETEITMSNVPVQQSTASKRYVTWDTDGLGVGGSLSLPSATTLYSADPYFTATADSATVNASVTISGYLKYKILGAKLEDLYFDIDTQFSADVGMTFNVTAPYNTTFDYSPDALSYSLLSVPGIVDFGPALVFGVGLDLGVEAEVSVTADLGVDFSDGSVHLDFLDGSATSTTGWTPSYHAAVNVTEQVAAYANPYVDLSVELELKLLDGLLDLSAGLKARNQFDNAFTLTAEQGAADATGANATAGQVNGTGSCANGLALDSSYEFSVIGFATQWLSTTLYDVKVPIADECYSWL